MNLIYKKPFYKGLGIGLTVLGILAFVFFGQSFIQNESGPQFLYRSDTPQTIESILSLPEDRWQKTGGFHLFAQKSINTPIEAWLKTSIQNGPQSQSFVIANYFSWYESIDIYLMRSTGPERIVIPQNIPQTYPNAEFMMAPHEKIAILVKTKGRGQFQYEVRILPAISYHKGDQLITTAWGIIFGIFSFFFIWNLLSAISNKDYGTFLYLGYLLTLLLSFFIFDLSRIRLLEFSDRWFQYLSLSAWVLPCLGAALAINFLLNFLMQKPTKWGLHYFTYVVAGVTFLSPFLPFNMLIPFCYATASVSFIAGSYLIFQNASVSTVYYLLLGWIGVFLTGNISTLATAGYLPADYLTLRAFYVGIIWEVVFFSLAISERVKLINKERLALENIIRGNAPQTDLNQILQRPYGFTYRLDNVEVTIMFIDIVDFSLTSENLGPKSTFKQLAQWGQHIQEIIERNNGTIDRSLGDGILCFFGYLEDDPAKHARDAFHSAIQIQNSAVQMISKSTSDRAIFPTRIGIHTAKVVVGNLGGQDRIDYTMIGDGVNYTSRLESACNSFRISLSKKTCSLLSPSDYEPESMNPIFIKIKHHRDFVEAFEYNPFPSDREKLIKAENLHYSTINKKGILKRTQARRESITLETDVATFEVLNFSSDGFGVISDQFIGPNSEVLMKIKLADADAMQDIQSKMLSEIRGVVKWSRVSNKRFKHGILLSSLNGEQKQFLFSILRRFAQREEKEAS